MGAQAESRSPRTAQAVAGAVPETSSSKLLEAVSGYLEGLHGRTPDAVKDMRRSPREQRRGPAGYESRDSKPQRLLQLDEKLSRTRIQRQEWDLAVNSLQRALQVAVVAAPADETARLKELLQGASQQASRGPERPPSAGEVTNSIGMRLVGIRQGTFVMGSSEAEIRRIQNEWNVQESLIQPEGPSHNVKISRPFLLGKYEVTVGQFKRFVQETGYRTVAEKQGWAWVYDNSKKHWAKKSGAYWKNTGAETYDDSPVTLICHEDAEAFCQWLSKREQRQYYLPSEAQWEYAARAGKNGERYAWGNDYPDGRKLNIADRHCVVPWADRTVDDGYGTVAPVGSYDPNDFRLYDMLGNVWELCSDVYDAKAYDQFKSGVAADPVVTGRGKKRAVRGGSWAFGPGIARNAFRFGIEADTCTDMSGFRIAASLAPDEADMIQVDTQSREENVQDPHQVEQLLSRVKSLVATGRRLQARRLVDKIPASGAKQSVSAEDANLFVREVLDALIDVTKDKSLESFKNSLGMNMVRIPAGSFPMGSSEADISWAMGTLAQGQPVNLENEFPVHKVRISRPFFIASTEVTVAQFREFVNETGYVTDAEDEKGGQVFNTETNQFERKAGTTWKNPGWTVSADQPVTVISYNDAQAFVEWLAAKEKLPYKLPTEAQWEYACRGGLCMAQFPWGDTLPDGRRANYADKNTDFQWRDRTADDGYKYVAPVGSYEPNGYGLYDMAGNVLEWCRDYYGEDYYRSTPEIDPEGPGHGENRVMKGGEWTFGPVNLRCSFRGWSRSDLAFYNSGFRVAIELGSPQRSFYFADDFLTKAWIPGSDQRFVEGAVSKEKDRQKNAASAERSRAAKPGETPASTPVRGVMVLDLSPKSDARKAGMTKGDVIIEYGGIRDLTAEKFLELTARTKREKTHPIVVFVREGYEYSVRAAPGSLGISVIDTVVTGPFKKPEPRQERLPEDDKEKKALDWT
jgi:formylglycine-generating enzyme required for sulfatase activity